MASQLIRRPSRGIILPVVFALTVLMLVLVIAMGTLTRPAAPS